MSLKWKIILNMWVLAALCTLTAEGVSSWLIVKNQEKAIEQHLRATATTLMSLGITDYSGLQGFEKLDSFIENALKLGKIYQVIHVFTEKGKLMFSSIPTAEIDFPSLFQPSSQPVFTTYKGEHRKYKILTTPYKAKNNKTYYLQITRPYPQFKDVAQSILKEAILLFLILSLLAFLISQLLAKKIVKPVRAIAMHLHDMNPSNIKGWKPLLLPKAGEYLKEIATGINELATRVRNALYSMSRTSRYLAHELRNPLAILTGEAEAVLSKPNPPSEEYRAVLESSLEEIERINMVVATISKISKKERALYNPSPCDIAVWIETNIPIWEKYLGKKITWIRPKNVIVSVLDQDLLFRLTDNLIRNIKLHSTKSVDCRITLESQEERPRIIIEDNGPGMAHDLIEELNKNNLMDARIGIGLGLCLEISSICNFQLEFKNKEDHGLIVSITLTL